jgi:hypothetical protein
MELMKMLVLKHSAAVTAHSSHLCCLPSTPSNKDHKATEPQREQHNPKPEFFVVKLTKY